MNSQTIFPNNSININVTPLLKNTSLFYEKITNPLTESYQRNSNCLRNDGNFKITYSSLKDCVYEMEYIKKYVEKTNSFLMEIYVNEKESFNYVTLPNETIEIYPINDEFKTRNVSHLVLNLSQKNDDK